MQQFGSYAAVISSHKDGDLLAKFLQVYRHEAIRGSTNRGGFGAIKGVMKSMRLGTSVVITPDGPRGPRYHINSNMLNIAIKEGSAIIPICYVARKSIILNSWDKFIIPHPFNHIIIEIAAPFYPKANEPEPEQRAYLQKMMTAQVKALKSQFR
jgi:lysophospholipid acyltransferase (LPLAT)-like uncharacterized protein